MRSLLGRLPKGGHFVVMSFSFMSNKCPSLWVANCTVLKLRPEMGKLPWLGVVSGVISLALILLSLWSPNLYICITMQFVMLRNWGCRINQHSWQNVASQELVACLFCFSVDNKVYWAIHKLIYQRWNDQSCEVLRCLATAWVVLRWGAFSLFIVPISVSHFRASFLTFLKAVTTYSVTMECWLVRAWAIKFQLRICHKFSLHFNVVNHHFIQ